MKNPLTAILLSAPLLGLSINMIELENMGSDDLIVQMLVPLDTPYCDINTLVLVDNHFEKLSREEIDLFLRSFHNQCRTNVEFSEWSNELLFMIMDTYTVEVMELLSANPGAYQVESILTELEAPIHDGIDPFSILEKIQLLQTNETTEKIIKALKKSGG